ncbi:MAG: class I SAM-dependent methyltransferase [Candidatus Eisenbacteria bacterium]|uniref:Class I SAM-dependent methyltransferase n=1 Tax=Eiseniibacteriota bacterium TaxID=2212470 RepID=A0A948RXZ7_UNCEI|nr:class I SAM-dependent methyltransferase [Candidatus Eisenbacteria bacterium]MBU1949456.1 class I SAM-dependent methyltransferase [Candidatus Eisenbacteria bacterium]MBU2691633.1 class I SAM-dependent methyltransferase [Candidatus Eisenbacteria bacterium]
MGTDDPYSRVDYRRLIAWPKRLHTEGPFLRKFLAMAPERSVLDLGCGTGEHSRFFHEEGFRVVGVDQSETMIAKATDTPCPPNIKFVRGDLVHLDDAVEGEFGAAISLGNTLVHITDAEDMIKALRGVRRHLCPGGLFLFQFLNYERIFEKKIRNLPLSFRDNGDEEIVFLRLMDLKENGWVRFCPVTLSYRRSADPPVEMVRAQGVDIRGWRREDMQGFLEAAGFQITAVLGDMLGGEYVPMESMDLVMIARKDGA